ncbi:SDR family NAD(P)-dependent oxidoreductase [Arthrobacter sp. PAMC25564]|uniref:SDR family NAD(P)-dependent oxidoreductase n=1 Tax=Arthrobacter sp. PAMC25564 TaxID=2565366 RepID=UPI00197B2BD0|nr:SDR family NAD(P)-dependent oxidoreductase [Arthrobacter sp. PAMC25564]
MLNGRSAVVTGGASGIGEAIARKLADAGAAVTIGDIGSSVPRIVDDITARGGRAEFIRTDVTDEPSVRGLMEGAARAFGGLDILVANAGIPEVKTPLHELDMSNWQRVIDVDLTGVAICNKWAVATILGLRREAAEPRTASVINMASILAHVGQANSNAYSAAKAAVANFTRSADLCPGGDPLQCGVTGLRGHAAAGATPRRDPLADDFQATYRTTAPTGRDRERCSVPVE